MWKSRALRLLLVAIALVVAGGALLAAQALGTFDNQQCAPDLPKPCWDNPNPWPGTIGTALAVVGLALSAGAYAGYLREKGRPFWPTSSRARPPSTGHRVAKPGRSSEGKRPEEQERAEKADNAN